MTVGAAILGVKLPNLVPKANSSIFLVNWETLHRFWEDKANAGVQNSTFSWHRNNQNSTSGTTWYERIC